MEQRNKGRKSRNLHQGNAPTPRTRTCLVRVIQTPSRSTSRTFVVQQFV
jgi:hypothetical protein